MDLVGIQGRLTALGVSLRFADDDDPTVSAALRAELITQRQYRAALYIDRLEATRDFLTNPLTPGSPAGPVVAGQNGLGPDYPFAQTALASGELLNDLAESLDRWICVAVNEAINLLLPGGVPNAPTPYEGWFNTQVFDPNNANYTARVLAFFAAWPITAHALAQITATFQHNVATATRRIVTDRARIVLLFSDLWPTGLALDSLTRIRSTGSDFHKGGMQVLILTFAVRTFYGWWWSELRVVYKPADMELDCLITGNSAAVNRAIPRANPLAPDFLDNSLVELFNAEAAANGPPGTEPLPTYRILPCERTSPAPGPGLPALRNAYGYSEYLEYSLTGTPVPWTNYYPRGASDYVIFRWTDPAPIVARFYHQMGQLLAIASIFSLTDLHIENVRVRGYQPHLIDLEAALTLEIADIGATVLFGPPIGGIDGWQLPEFIYHFTNRANASALGTFALSKSHQNRLKRCSSANITKHVIPVDPLLLAQGLDRGLQVLAALAVLPAMAAWFVRAQRVLVRILPVATDDWRIARKNIYDDMQVRVPGSLLGPTIVEEMRAVLTAEHGRYAPGPGAQPAPPEYVVVAAPQATTDMTNFDIPVFYHRVGSRDLLDSMGTVMAMPANVLLDPQPAPATPTNIGRATYYPGPPIPPPATAHDQLAALPAGLVATTATFTGQILVHMNLAAMPLAPAVVL